MRNLKKFLALVMAMIMAFSLMMTASAATTANVTYPDSAQADEAFDEAITVLSGMGVFSGDNGEFYPTRNVTRAEAAALIYRLATGDVEDTQAGLYAQYGNFADVKPDAWYAGYVGYCANAGYIKGRPGNVFDPSGSVTGYEVLAMILRVVGYDKNGEFTGADWQVNVSALSQTLGVIANVKTTQYGGTLHLAAQRQVVADLLFQTDAFVPQVVYTTAFGYQTTGMSGGVAGSTVNPTLGQKVFGLTANHGVIVGNETTGEAKGTTKIGFSLASARTASEISGTWDDTTTGTPGDVWGSIVTTQTAFATKIDDSLTINAYDTDGDQVADQWASAYNYASDTIHALPGNVTRTFKWDSDLTQFNHKVKVWYDNRSSQTVSVGTGINGSATFTNDLDTYAVFDEVVATAVVNLNDTTETNVTTSALAALTRGAADNENNWNAAGMSARTNAYFNYAFAPMSTANYGVDVSAGSAVSPILKNDETEAHPLYLLISNSSNKALDVVISLDLTMTQIVQANNTTDPYSVGVLAANEAGASAAGSNSYFGDSHDYGLLNNNTQGRTTNYVSLAQDNLVNSPNLALRTKVAAIEITGTAPTRNLGDIAPDDEGAADPVDPFESTFYYQLTENKFHKTATVIRVDYLNQNVTLSDGTVLHQSVFAEATDATFTTNIEGATSAPSNVLVAGRDYTFTLDAADGNYIYWETASNTEKFVYGTYIDFTTQVASGAFDYPLVYVGTDGQRGQENIVKVVDGVIDNSADQAIDDSMSAWLYDELLLNKRDNASAGNTSGYEKGKYIGYALSSNGTLTAVTSTDSQNTGFYQATDSNNFGDNVVTIDGTDVVIGAKEIGSGSNLFLTGNTQFYLVDGAGTSSQKVTPFKGLQAIMEGMDNVVIDATTTAKLYSEASTYLAQNDHPWDMIYYEAGNFEYAQNYDPSAREIKTVFIPADLVTFNKSNETSLVFVGSNDSKLISSRQGAEATLFAMYKNGVAEDIWIEGYTTDASSAAQVIGQDGWENTFYNLVETNKKAADGQPVYTIREVTNADRKIVGAYFEGTIASANREMTELPGVAGNSYIGAYKATTYSQQVAILTYDNGDELYNVGNAGVLNLNKAAYPGINNTLADLNNAGSLYDNIGVPVSCLLNTSDSTLRTVSFIYVNAPS